MTPSWTLLPSSTLVAPFQISYFCHHPISVFGFFMAMRFLFSPYILFVYLLNVTNHFREFISLWPVSGPSLITQSLPLISQTSPVTHKTTIVTVIMSPCFHKKVKLWNVKTLTELLLKFTYNPRFKTHTKLIPFSSPLHSWYLICRGVFQVTFPSSLRNTFSSVRVSSPTPV